MKNQKWFATSIVSTVFILTLASLMGPLAASSAPRFARFYLPKVHVCGDYELNHTQERVYFKDRIEYITAMADGTFVLEYAQQAAYYSIDPSQTPDAMDMLSRAQSALSQGDEVYSTASTAPADLHVIQYLNDRKDPRCFPERSR